MVNTILIMSSVFTVLSFICRDILKLRLFNICSNVLSIIAATVAGYNVPGMMVIFLLNLALFVINAVQIYWLLIERWPITLPEDLKWLYLNVFKNLTVFEFLKILGFSKTVKSPLGSTLTEEGSPVPDLYLIKQGVVKILKKNNTVAHLQEGFFIGEMNYFTHDPATASVYVDSADFECIKWDKNTLANLKEKEEKLFNKFEVAIAIDLIKKLDRSFYLDK